MKNIKCYWGIVKDASMYAIFFTENDQRHMIKITNISDKNEISIFHDIKKGTEAEWYAKAKAIPNYIGLQQIELALGEEGTNINDWANK